MGGREEGCHIPFGGTCPPQGTPGRCTRAGPAPPDEHATGRLAAGVHGRRCHAGSSCSSTKEVTALLWFYRKGGTASFIFFSLESASTMSKSSYTESLKTLRIILLGINNLKC